MCTRKREITLPRLDNYNNIWKMPEQLSRVYLNGGKPKMLAKCGKCYECKKERARNWTYKIWLEALSYTKKCFLTLTYKDNEKGKNLDKAELQRFIKRLRKNEKASFKYFGAGEYGEKKGRAHYHVILLGWQPKDIKKLHGAKSKKGKDLYTSEIIKKTWGHGRITVQPFAKDEVGYLTLYIGNNDFIEDKINHEEVKQRKELINELKCKYGVLKKNINIKTAEISYQKLKRLKDLDNETYKAYKKDYNNNVNVIKFKKTPEFNISSKNMGFNNYIDKKYYMYDLNIDNYKYEIPKEYLRKISDDALSYNKEVIEWTNKKLLERKKYAEENIIDVNSKEAKREARRDEERQFNDNENNKKLYKHIESIF